MGPKPLCGCMGTLLLWPALIPCSECELVIAAQGTACLLPAFTRGFSGAFLGCRTTLWVPFLHSETEAHLGFGSSFVLWDPVETESTTLLLRMAFDQNRPGAQQLLEELDWLAVNSKAILEFILLFQNLFRAVSFNRFVLWGFCLEASEGMWIVYKWSTHLGNC